MMNRILIFVILLLMSPIGFSKDPISGGRPNIIFILTDDQGYGDISAHGNPILKTPNLDRLRSESVRFLNFHVSPTCSPTRSALLTGRHEFKNGVTHTIFERERLTLDATTVAQVLQSSGYSTGIFGKWHLGDEAAYQPDRRGFDEVYIHGGGGIGQTFPGSCGDAPGNTYFDPTILHNGKFEKSKGYCADLYFEKAMTWIDSQRTRGQPIFATITTNTPHDPYIARPADKALYENKNLSANTENFFGMIRNIDQNVGALLDQLRIWGIEDHTLVIFMNDNGGTAGVQLFNAGMRGSKGTAWLGGTRASSFWRWPGTIVPNDCDALTAHIDFFPTLAEIAGVPLSDLLQQQVEGTSLVPFLRDPASAQNDRTLFTHLGRWPKIADPNLAKYRMCGVLTSRWHLVSEKGDAEPKWELFDLKSDYAEAYDVANKHPEIVSRLALAFDNFWTQSLPFMVNEQVIGPSINPFQELYFRQFGGAPSKEDLARMAPRK